MDNLLGNIILGPLHNTIKSSHFDSLLEVKISFERLFLTSRNDRIMTDIGLLTEEKLANQIRLLLHPWNERGILQLCSRDWGNYV